MSTATQPADTPAARRIDYLPTPALLRARLERAGLDTTDVADESLRVLYRAALARAARDPWLRFEHGLMAVMHEIGGAA